MCSNWHRSNIIEGRQCFLDSESERIGGLLTALSASGCDTAKGIKLKIEVARL